MIAITARTPTCARLRVISSSAAARHLSSLPLSDDKDGKAVEGKAAATTAECPFKQTLKKVPTLPFVGSMIPQHSGVPIFTFETQYSFNNEMRKRFGNFSQYGMPGFGNGIRGLMYTIYDPTEMAKIVRSEGAYPSGVVEKLWQWRRAMKESGSLLVTEKTDDAEGETHSYGLFDKGDTWKRHRAFLQTGMLDPKAAKGFLPGIINAATVASQVAPQHADNINDFLNYTAFDMFSSFMFGAQLQTTATIVSSDPTIRERNAENEKFVNAAIGVFAKTNEMNLYPQEYLMAKYLPFYKSKRYTSLMDDWNTVREIGLKKMHDFVKRHDEDKLNENERNCYLAGAIKRQRESNEITQDEMVELCLIALFVGVDTTSSVTAWNLMHLAMNEDCQEKLYDELSSSLKEYGTTLDANVLEKKASPYLHMCIRESHRATPAFTAAMWKSNSHKDVEVHGVTLPKGSMIQMGHISYDPEYVDDYNVFRPERWAADEVKSRKGTKSEVLDHPFLRDPFSQGARRCPGSRVAANEILAMISRMVLDWKISFAPGAKINSLADVNYDSSPIKPNFPTMKFEAR